MGTFNTVLWAGGTPSATIPVTSISGRQIIYGALKLLTVLGTGRGANDETWADGLRELNEMVDAWSINRLNIPSIARQLYPVAANQSAYQMGDGAPDMNAPRPVQLHRAGVYIAGDPNTERPLLLLNLEQWAAIGLKGTLSPLPSALYCDYAFPYASLSLFPVLSAPATLALYLWSAVIAFGDLDTVYDIPQGYALALRYNLASQMAPSFVMQMKGPRQKVQVLLDKIEATAATSLGAIRNANLPRPIMRCDAAFTGRGRGRWDARGNVWI